MTQRRAVGISRPVCEPSVGNVVNEDVPYISKKPFKCEISTYIIIYTYFVH